jgi:hypothetical protein
MRVATVFADHTPSSRRGRERYGVLLAAIIAAFTVQGVASPGPWEQVAVSVLLGATLVLAMRAGDVRPSVARPVAALAAVAVIASVVEAEAGTVEGTASQLANLLLVTLAPPAVVVGIVRSLRSHQRVTIEAVFGVLCLYILLGMFFAFIYGSIDRIHGSFFANGASATVSHCLYFSFTTLTTVGYGDFTAQGNVGHTLSISEALLGQIYLVTVVSVIVGNLGWRRQSEPSDRSEHAANPKPNPTADV